MPDLPIYRLVYALEGINCSRNRLSQRLAVPKDASHAQTGQVTGPRGPVNGPPRGEGHLARNGRLEAPFSAVLR